MSLLTLRAFNVVRVPSRAAAVPGSITLKPPSFPKDKKPPSLDEYNHLEPGEWQLGAGGKLLPRLPVGTKVGKLVMGKYGLYNPVLKREAELIKKLLDEGADMQTARPRDRVYMRILVAAMVVTVTMIIWNFAVLLSTDLIWPLKGRWKIPGSTN